MGVSSFYNNSYYLLHIFWVSDRMPNITALSFNPHNNTVRLYSHLCVTEEELEVYNRKGKSFVHYLVLMVEPGLESKTL